MPLDESISESTESKSQAKQFYWTEQIKGQQENKLNGKAYCQAQDINYDRFKYWYRKLVKQPEKAIPVRLKVSNLSHPLLCTLELSQGRRLLIYDASIVELLVGRLS